MQAAALVQSNFRFMGKDRVRGETIPPEELAKSTPQVIAALKGQGLIVIGGEAADQSHLQAQVDALYGHVKRTEAFAAAILGGMNEMRAAQGLEPIAMPEEPKAAVVEAKAAKPVKAPVKKRVPARKKPKVN